MLVECLLSLKLLPLESPDDRFIELREPFFTDFEERLMTNLSTLQKVRCCQLQQIPTLMYTKH